MAFLDELGKVISDKSKEAANKVKDITGVIQLKSKLSAEKEKVNKAYISLGKAYYDRHEAALEDEYADEFKIIQAGLIKMAVLELEGTRVCAECGAKVEREALYCSKCGAPMEDKMAGASEDEDSEEPGLQFPVKTAADESIFAEEDSENEE